MESLEIEVPKEPYKTLGFAIPFGAGVKYALNDKWVVGVEFGLRKTFTDYLDDVSTVYPDKDDLAQLRNDLAVTMSDRSILIPGVNDGQIGEAGRQRGESNNKDSYVMFGVGLVYYFGDIRCPDTSAISGRAPKKRRRR